VDLRVRVSFQAMLRAQWSSSDGGISNELGQHVAGGGWRAIPSRRAREAVTTASDRLCSRAVGAVVTLLARMISVG
jgi:hypothetical protein